MATGGTIPSGRKQYVYFYNTHGVIEKDKQMYFAPRFRGDNEGEAVSEAFLELFEEVCPPSSAYSEIEISSWSPQDRTLVVKGNIDDFRLITDEGACLNYFLVKREVTKGEGQQASTATYYYAFFITGVEQIGGSSVKITAEPDDFTNVFYFHNTHVLSNAEAVSGSYEPFNERMKNCYVNRQHYDRVDFENNYILHVDLTNVASGISLALGAQISIEFESTDPVTVSGTIVGYDDNDYDMGDLYLEIKTSEQVEIGPEENLSHIYYEGETYSCQYIYEDIRWDENEDIIPTNQKIFLNQEDSFRFKYQYRDERRPFALSKVFTEAELDTIKQTSSFSLLSNSLKSKVIKVCIQYLVVEMKSTERESRIYYSLTEGDWSYRGVYLANNSGGFNKETVNLATPFFNIPDFLKKYESSLSAYKLYFNIKGSATALLELDSASKIYNILNKLSLSDFALGAFIVSDLCIPENLINVDIVNQRVLFECNMGYTDSVATGFVPTSQDLFVVPIDYDVTNQTPSSGLGYVVSVVPPNPDTIPSKVVKVGDTCIAMLMNSGFNSRDFSINISEDRLTNRSILRNGYVDPVLEAEPYSFYSLSYLAYEMPFNKNRYYQDMKIKFSYYISVNSAIKISYIPSYKVEEEEYKYFNESMVFTLPSNLPLTSDSYLSYYYQNQAQMKNQFAVNDYNRGVDLAQHFFIGGPTKVGGTAITKGGYGALAETVNQFGQMIDEAVDWAQSNKVIEMNQQAKLADMGAKPDVVKQAGSDVFSDLFTTENRPFFNHYRIDNVSYNTIAKFLERFGYQVNLYDSLNTIDRVGWNFVKLNSFDWNPASQYDIMIEQEDSIKKIFLQGVTLLHNTYYLTSGHNYEVILD